MFANLIFNSKHYEVSRTILQLSKFTRSSKSFVLQSLLNKPNSIHNFHLTNSYIQIL